MERSSYPLAPEYGYPRSDAEAADDQGSKELRSKKRMKCFLYFIAFVIFQTGIIVLFTLTIMKIRTPKFRMQTVTFDSFTVINGTEANPSFDSTLNLQLSVKNANFGTFKYENSTMYLLYQGSPIGEVSIPRSSAGWRSNKKFGVIVNVNSSNLPANSSIGSDLRAGVLHITTRSNLVGKVKLMQIFKKKKMIQMICSLDINTANQQASNIACK